MKSSSLQVKAKPRPGAVQAEARLLGERLRSREPVTAAVWFVPKVTPALRALLDEAGIGYFDLHGACHLRWPGLFIDRAGQAEPLADLVAGLRDVGEESSGRNIPEADEVFGPAATSRHRILRLLLSDPTRRWHQKDLAREAGVSAKPAFEVVHYLLRDHWADYDGTGPNKVFFLTRPGALLETWARFWEDSWKRAMRRAGLYFSLESNPDRIVEALSAAAETVGTQLGLTLAIGANRFGAYLRDDVVHVWALGETGPLAKAADLDQVRSGANVVLLPARDAGVLYLPERARRQIHELGELALSPVSPVQLYLDMRAAGGRYSEQAESLRKDVLGY
jgi:hypothetical protein